MIRYISLLLFIGLAFWGCEEEQEPEDCAGVSGGDNICGCIDSTATNYDSTATFNDESCEYDTTPPTVTITFSTDDSVSEIVTITCISTDNEGVEKVELWVDGVSTGIIDDTEPYSLEWNTTTYEDGSYVITVRSYDASGNTTDSEPITLIVYRAVQDADVVGIWDISNFTINNISNIQNNNIILSVDDIYTYLMDATDWNFQEDGEIIIDFVTLYMPEGTGETMSGNWVTSEGDIQITFDELSFSTIDGVDYTATYFNDIYFQYEISGQNMTLIAGDTVVVFQKN
jgi:hypothetical protein